MPRTLFLVCFDPTAIQLTVPSSLRHIRKLAEDVGVPMPIIDTAHQHLVTARAVGGASLDWSSLVAGQRIAAGLPPFKRHVRLERYEDST